MLILSFFYCWKSHWWLLDGIVLNTINWFSVIVMKKIFLKSNFFFVFVSDFTWNFKNPRFLTEVIEKFKSPLFVTDFPQKSISPLVSTTQPNSPQGEYSPRLPIYGLDFRQHFLDSPWPKLIHYRTVPDIRSITAIPLP